MNRLMLLLAAAALLAVGAGSRFTPRPVTSSRSHPHIEAASHHASNDEEIDTYGNEVTSAVAEYSLDPDGALYEVHSPQTDLPHLGSPKS